MHRSVAALLIPFFLQACSMDDKADLIITGKIWTGDPEEPAAQALAIKGNSIIAVGDSTGILARYLGEETRRLDNGDRTVLPGFMDSHTHFVDGGYQLASVELRDAESPGEFTARIKAYAATLAPGEWITGGNWDHERWPGAALPERGWIDSVTGNNPVFVSRLDGHMGLANTAALNLAGITSATQDPPGGTIVHDPDTGEPTGVLKDAAMGPVYDVMPAPSASQQDSALTRAMRHAAELGVTTVSHVSAGWNDLAAYRRAREQGRLTTRVNLYFPLFAWQTVSDTVEADGPGDDWIRVDGVKDFVDGSLGSTTAWFFEPYDDAPNTTGLILTEEDSLRAWISAADSRGLQVVVHAIGDRANALLLDIFNGVATAHGQRDRRFRIEHAQHLRPTDIKRFAEIGVIPSMQPYHVIDDGRWAEKRIGPERIKTTYAFRSLLDAGARLSFGSDWTVATLNPMEGIYAAVTRRTLDGLNPDGWVPEEKITLEEALHAYTSTNAWAMHREDRLGMLREGYLADMVLLDQDIFAIPPEELGEVKPRATIVGGQVVYESGP